MEKIKLWVMHMIKGGLKEFDPHDRVKIYFTPSDAIDMTFGKVVDFVTELGTHFKLPSASNSITKWVLAGDVEELKKRGFKFRITDYYKKQIPENTFVVSEIIWDTDDEEIDLPKSITVEVPADLKDDQEKDEYISDYITEKTGFCHKGYVLDHELYY